MCNQAKSVTLENAVSETVREFAQQSRSFSAHDITMAIRAKCNSGELEIPGTETGGGNIKFYISHVDVNNVFKNMFRSQTFEPDFSLSRVVDPTGNYFIYTPSDVSGVTYASTTTATSPSVAQTSPVATPTGPVIATVLHGKPTRPVIGIRVKEYLTNCSKKNFRPTLKQVQSAIKRGSVSTGWTCEELADVIRHDLNYVVVDDPSYISESQVATV